MTFQHFIGICTIAVAFTLSSCTSEEKTDPEKKMTGITAIKEENVTYTADGVTMNGYIAYDSANKDKRPVVLVVHEWWGQNDYPRMRAKQMAELGYLPMAVDMYGNGKTVDNPTDAGALAGPFYGNPTMAKTRFDAALTKIKTYPQAGDKIA